jgi:hypothetical protein
MKKVSHTPAQVRSLVAKAAKANASAFVTVKEARVLSSVATFAALDSGNLGGTSPLWSTSEEFVLDLGLVNAEGKPASKSSVTGLGRLGRALALGLDPVKEGERWNVLSSKAGTKEVGDVLGQKVEKVTLTQVRKLADALIVARDADKSSGPTLTADEKKAAKVAAAKKAAKEAQEAALADSTPADRIAVAITMLEKEFGEVDDDAFAKFAQRIEKAIEKERVIRAKAQAVADEANAA